MINIIFTEGNAASNLFPFTYMRPVAECRSGIWRIREKWSYYIDGLISHATRDYLRQLYPLKLARENLIINGSVLPEATLVNHIKQLSVGEWLVCGDELIAGRFDKETTKAYLDFGNKVFSSTPVPVEPLYRLQYPEDFVSFNAKQIELDYNRITSGRNSRLLDGSCTCWGDDIFIEEGALVRGATLNAESGPIYIGEGAEIMEGSVIRGPFALGAYGIVKLASRIYGGTSSGPKCKLGGEIKNTLFFGYSSKGHDGFLGDSVVGEWCNFGAGSSCSNLKNTYGEIRVNSLTSDEKRNSGRQFLGVLMGDHSKCAINTELSTGTVVGIFANIYNYDPSGIVPSFSWGNDGIYDRSKMIEVARRVMTRRNESLTDAHIEVLNYLHESLS